MDKKVCGKEMETYFAQIDAKLAEAYEISAKARARGFDPEDKPPIQLASDMAERVEGLISVAAPQIIGSGLSNRIKELEGDYGSLDWRVALAIAYEIAQEKLCRFKDRIEAMEVGIRVGLAYLTMGTVSSPLEGFLGLKVRKTVKGTEYLAPCFGGPMRSAGGTMEAVCVVIVDYVRVKMGYDAYDPNESEIKRFVSELYDYHERVTNLQYLPSEEEIEFLARRLPVQIDGDPSEKMEVSNYKDLPRVQTNQIRNGVCLVLGEGIAQKAPKVWKQISKWGKDFGLDHWAFLGEFVELQKKIKAHAKKDSGGEKSKVMPDYTFIKDLVAGRPVFTHPLRVGGFRLRYGRSRTSGFSSYPIHPATMHVLNQYLAVGSQLKMERPGKATSLTSSDSLEGPVVRLSNGDVLQLHTLAHAKQVCNDVVEIIFLGDILINYGDFFNRNHLLVPPGYCVEWYALELEKAIVTLCGSLDTAKVHDLCGIDAHKLDAFLKDPFSTIFVVKEAVALSLSLGVPLFPYYSYHYKTVSPGEIVELVAWLKYGKWVRDGEEIDRVILPLQEKPKRVADLLGIPHSVKEGFVTFHKEQAQALYITFDISNKSIEQCQSLGADCADGLELVQKISPIKHRDRSGIFIGARMGRPEKAKERELTGSPQVLFPVGDEGGRLRSFQSALQVQKVTADFPLFHCANCQMETIFRTCESCEKPAQQRYWCRGCQRIVPSDKCDVHGPALTYNRREVPIQQYFLRALRKLKMSVYPDLIKGIRGTSNKFHVTERIEKGILRAKHGVHVNKDGTTRYDMTQLPITHFKPCEVYTPIEKLQELGYEKDIRGLPLADSEQVLELKPQDIILPMLQPPFEGADKCLKRVANFIDDMLISLYGLPPYYKVESPIDLVGHLVLCLAPHTAAGITARIIGFSTTQGFFAHPIVHAAQRRDCDGDESCVTLVLDALLNFSRHYLPAHRGSTQDAPLVLTSRLVPAEVDDMVFDMDTVWRYPLEFYEACMEYKNPSDLKIEQLKARLGHESQYEGFGYTHPTSNINCSPPTSAYKTLPSMREKMEGQMDIARKVRAVDTEDVARLIIEKHFLKDTRGNLRKFSMQQFRCVACNEKFRRPPLIGRCTGCKGKILFTISEGSVVKYLEPTIGLARKYAVSPYLRQTIDVLQRKIEGVFGREKEKQAALASFLGAATNGESEDEAPPLAMVEVSDDEGGVEDLCAE
ncbi:DNA polymerase II large subunit [Candidatus Woesearchaeota archaeon]|nr:DNA polymerase II large subunit [Candidatus Woesearchaeota archaeon]